MKTIASRPLTREDCYTVLDLAIELTKVRPGERPNVANAIREVINNVETVVWTLDETVKKSKRRKKR